MNNIANLLTIILTSNPGISPLELGRFIDNALFNTDIVLTTQLN